MTTSREQMKIMEAELARIRAEIARLKVQEDTIVSLMAKISGAGAEPAPRVRTRSPAIKPLVLDFMRVSGELGATTADVDTAIRAVVPTVAKDTVGSVLSRLKSEGALVYAGERYYEKQFAPKGDTPFEPRLRAVN